MRDVKRPETERAAAHSFVGLAESGWEDGLPCSPVLVAPCGFLLALK